MLKYQLGAIIILFVIKLNSQTFKWIESDYKISYIFTYTTNLETGERSSDDPYFLFGVNNTSYFIRYQDYYNDSISYEFEKKYGPGQENVELFSELVLSNVKRGSKSKLRTIKFLDVNTAEIILPKLGNHTYMETPLNFDWEIGFETDTILNLVCHKATTNYGGRNYIAWFTPEIPISDGPYVFKGLPGLILRVYDFENQYEFLCHGINSNKENIILSKNFLNPNNIQISRKEYVSESSKMKSNPSYPPGMRNVTPQMKLRLKKNYDKRYDLLIERN